MLHMNQSSQAAMAQMNDVVLVMAEMNKSSCCARMSRVALQKVMSHVNESCRRGMSDVVDERCRAAHE